MAFFQATRPTFRRLILDQMLATLATRPAAALLTTPMVRLFKSPLSFNPDSPISVFHAAEAGFEGYAAIALPAASLPAQIGSGNEGLLYNVIFQAAGFPASPSDTIYGYWVDQNTGADWVIAETFPQPVPMQSGINFIDLTVILALGLVPALST